VKGFRCRPIATTWLGARPASESLRGRKPRIG
jgi:hypothetical protein